MHLKHLPLPLFAAVVPIAPVPATPASSIDNSNASVPVAPVPAVPDNPVFSISNDTNPILPLPTGNSGFLYDDACILVIFVLSQL
jgi:hypothetical protein